MKFTKFPESNLILKGNGTTVEDLHVWQGDDEDGTPTILTCFDIMPLEKVLLLFYGKIYFQQASDGKNFAPIKITVDNPFRPFTEPFGKVVGALIDRKVKQFVADMSNEDMPLFDDQKLEHFEKILNGFGVWLLTDLTKLEETK